MKSDLAGAVDRDLTPLDELAWEAPAGPAMAMRLLWLREAFPPYGGPVFIMQISDTEPIDWSVFLEQSEEELPKFLDRVTEALSVGDADLLEGLPHEYSRPSSFERRARRPRVRGLLAQAVRWLDRSVLERTSQPSNLVERCLWRGAEMHGPASDPGTRGLPSPEAVLSSSRLSVEERVRCWVDALLVAVGDPKPSQNLALPDCRDGHIMLRAVEHIEADEGFDHSLSSGTLWGSSADPDAYEACRLRSLLHRLAYEPHGATLTFGGQDDAGRGPTFGVALVNRAFDMLDARERNHVVHGKADGLKRFVNLPRDFHSLTVSRRRLIAAMTLKIGRRGVLAVAVPPKDSRGFEDYIEEGLLRCVIQLPGRAGIVLILEGLEGRGDDAQESPVLFISIPDGWKHRSKLGTSVTLGPEGQSPLDAIAAIVVADRAGSLAAKEDFGANEPAFSYVSRDEIRRRRYELRSPPHPADAPQEEAKVSAEDLEKELEAIYAREKARNFLDKSVDLALDRLLSEPNETFRKLRERTDRFRQRASRTSLHPGARRSGEGPEDSSSEGVPTPTREEG